MCVCVCLFVSVAVHVCVCEHMCACLFVSACPCVCAVTHISRPCVCAVTHISRPCVCVCVCVLSHISVGWSAHRFWCCGGSDAVAGMGGVGGETKNTSPCSFLRRSLFLASLLPNTRSGGQSTAQEKRSSCGGEILKTRQCFTNSNHLAGGGSGAACLFILCSLLLFGAVYCSHLNILSLFMICIP